MAQVPLRDLVRQPQNWNRLTRGYQAVIERALQVEAQAVVALGSAAHHAHALTAELIDVLCLAALASLEVKTNG